MSEQTKAALDAAIREHIADEHEGSLTASWLVIAEHMPEEDDGNSHIVDVSPDMQSAVTSIGLAYFLAQRRVHARGDDG